MIGNDVIDLDLARIDSDWQRRGFLEKIFTAAEQELIFNHEIPEIMVWVLWSKKEAAYKIYNRMTSQRAYSPLFFECVDVDPKPSVFFAKVGCGDFTFYTKAVVTKNSIRTIAVNDARDLKRVKVLDNNISIRKGKDGVPDFFDEFSNEFRPVSISHHGRFENIVTL
jgi:phosphopantetheinyl transferase (holo-ACP synthase)